MFAPSAGYDRAITIFSPDGRLYQVEYALETVRRGSLAVGVRTNEGVVLAVEERGRKLQSGYSVVKMFQIDDHIGAVGAGLTLSLRRNGPLLALLVLPLAVPVLIFGARATALAIQGESLAAPLYLLAAIAVLSATLAPWALAAAVRIGLE